MTDNGLAALAAALRDILPRHTEGTTSHPPSPYDRTWTVYDWTTPEHAATAILGERGVFLPDGAPYINPEGVVTALHQQIMDRDATIATLRAALVRSQAVADELDAGLISRSEAISILRAMTCHHTNLANDGRFCLDCRTALAAARETP